MLSQPSVVGFECCQGRRHLACSTEGSTVTVEVSQLVQDCAAPISRPLQHITNVQAAALGEQPLCIQASRDLSYNAASTCRQPPFQLRAAEQETVAQHRTPQFQPTSLVALPPGHPCRHQSCSIKHLHKTLL